MVWSVFRGPILGDQSGRDAFSCSVALVSSFSEAFSCSVAFIFRFSDFRKRYKNNGFGAWRSFRGSSGDPWGKALRTPFRPIDPKANFSGPHMIRVKPIAVFNKMVSSKRGSLEEGSGDAFLPNRSKSKFFRTPV